MLGHEHLTQHHKLVPLSHLFQDFKEKIAASRGTEKRLAMITAASNEVEIARHVIAFQTRRHLARIVGQARFL